LLVSLPLFFSAALSAFPAVSFASAIALFIRCFDLAIRMRRGGYNILILFGTSTGLSDTLY
jgi:hypothetical protein